MSDEEKAKSMVQLCEDCFSKPLCTCNNLVAYNKLIEMADWKENNPSDELIIKILNAIGYEEKQWVEFVKKHMR